METGTALLVGSDLTSVGRDKLIAGFLSVTKERDELERLRVFLPLDRRMKAARSKHPEGVAFRDITEEFLEFTREVGRFNEERSLDEVLDLATVCLRYYLGERSE